MVQPAGRLNKKAQQQSPQREPQFGVQNVDEGYSKTMPKNLPNNPFEITPASLASSTSQISPSPARATSVKSGRSQLSNRRLSNSPNRAARSVSFAGTAKSGASAGPQINAMIMAGSGSMIEEINSTSAQDIKFIQNERIDWQSGQITRFIELPQIDPSMHKTLNLIYPVVRDQTLFLSDQFRELDKMLENKQGMVSKYKTLNQTHKKTVQENSELAAELARLKTNGQKAIASPTKKVQDAAQSAILQLQQQNQQLQNQNEALQRVNQAENQKVAKNVQAESAGQVAQLNQTIVYLEQQNDNYVSECSALRQAQIDMEERHTAEIIELKSNQLSAVKENVHIEDDEDGEETLMLVNLVKIKDEEITELKNQLEDLRNQQIPEAEVSPRRTNVSPLRQNRSASSSKKLSLSAKSNRLEDQLQAMNQETLEDQVKALIKDNYDLKMQNAADVEEIDHLTREVDQLKQPFKLEAQQDELRDVKCSVYEIINTCQHMLISQSMEYDQHVDTENNLRLNRELFGLELTNLTDLSRFLNWEISHLQTISDLASQLRRLISVQEFKPTGEIRRQLEQMISPQQLQSQQINSVEQLVDIVRLNQQMQRQQMDVIVEDKAKAQMEAEQRIMLLTRENQTLIAGYKDAQKQTQQHEMRNQAEMTRDAIQKMEQLVKLNDDLMKSNSQLQQQAQQNYQACQSGEGKIQKLQKDLTFYINKANTLEHAVAKQQIKAQGSPERRYNQAQEDTKMSKSMIVRSTSKNAQSPFQQSRPNDQLQPVFQKLQSSQPPADLYGPYNLQRHSINSGSQHKLSRKDLQESRNDINKQNQPVEESSKLNMLIEEYRRENDRCSKRINDLQRKLNATANRRIRNETTNNNQGSNNKGNKTGGSKSPLGHYQRSHGKTGNNIGNKTASYRDQDQQNERSPERNYGRVRSQASTSLRRSQQQQF